MSDKFCGFLVLSCTTLCSTYL